MIFGIILEFNQRIKELNAELTKRDKLCAYLLEHESKQIILTAYNSLAWQTNEEPEITASGTKTSYSTLALSRDLIKHYNQQAELNFGDTVRVIIKDALIEDTMNRRYKNRGDMWTDSYTEAKQFGKKSAWIVYKKGEIR